MHAPRQQPGLQSNSLRERMRKHFQVHLSTWVALAAAGLWGFSVFIGYSHDRLRFLDRIETAMTDTRTLLRGVRKPPDLVTIIAIDDALVKQGGSYPIARADLARIIDAIARLQPRVLAVDILLVDRRTDEGDDALAASLKALPSVIASAAVFTDVMQPVAGDRDSVLTRLPNAEKFLLPLDKFTDVASVGVVNVATGQDGSPRAIPLMFRSGASLELSFPLRAAALAEHQEPAIEPDRLVLGTRSIATDTGYALPVTFYGPRRTIKTVSAATVLAGNLAPADVRNKIVVIGATVTGGGDFFPTPFDRVMPGVEVISTAITHLMAGDSLLRDRTVRLADGVIAVLLPMILVGLLAWRRGAAGLLAAGAVVLLWAASNLYAFQHGVWLSAAVPIAAAAPAAILFGAEQLWAGRRRAQFFAMKSELLREFQAPAIEQWLTRDPDFLLKPVRQNAAMVFIDLSGFTPLSERLGPDAVRDLLKDFHALIDKAVEAHDGTITAFMGDGAMILFGLPKPAIDDASRAVDCAIALCTGTVRWLNTLPPATATRLGFKTGAHYGTIIASRLGGGSHHHITATGDAVNVANRLMEVAARHNVELALSDDLLGAAGRIRAQIPTGTLSGPIDTEIRGRAGGVKVWLWRG